MTNSEDWSRQGGAGNRAGAGRVTDSEDLARVRVSRAGAWRKTDSEDLARPSWSRDGADSEDWGRLRVSRARAWIVTTLGRISWLDRQPDCWLRPAGPTDSDVKKTEISRCCFLLDPLHPPSTGLTCCCLLSLPFSRLFPSENRARLVEHVCCVVPRGNNKKPIVSIWIFALGTGQAI